MNCAPQVGQKWTLASDGDGESIKVDKDVKVITAKVFHTACLLHVQVSCYAAVLTLEHAARMLSEEYHIVTL
jgi:hypothetical protein